jgi:RNA polymerase sigma-70 factor (ECF subfamily)
LRAVVGLDARAAGAVLGKRAGAVRVAAHRGLKKLAQQARYHPEEGRWTLV